MICCCCNRAGRFVLNSVCCDKEQRVEERIGLLAEEIDREKTKQRREIACSALPNFPTFIIDLILEFEQGTREEKIRIAENETRLAVYSTLTMSSNLHFRDFLVLMISQMLRSASGYSWLIFLAPILFFIEFFLIIAGPILISMESGQFNLFFFPFNFMIVDPKTGKKSFLKIVARNDSVDLS